MKESTYGFGVSTHEDSGQSRNEVLTHGIEVSTHVNRGQSIETDDQESTHVLEMSTYVTNSFKEIL